MKEVFLSSQLCWGQQHQKSKYISLGDMTTQLWQYVYEWDMPIQYLMRYDPCSSSVKLSWACRLGLSVAILFTTLPTVYCLLQAPKNSDELYLQLHGNNYSIDVFIWPFCRSMLVWWDQVVSFVQIWNNYQLNPADVQTLDGRNFTGTTRTSGLKDL